MQLARPRGYSPQTKQQFVYQTLRDAIMKVELQPGQRLVIEDIAQQLGVSPIPVREALQLLQSERLVTNIPHVGAVVASVSHNSIAETFTVMEGLEIVGTRAATERASQDDLDQLNSLVAEMDRAIETGETENWGDLNTRFHLSIAAMTDMPLLQEMTQRAFGQWDRLRRFFFKGVLSHRAHESQEQHKQVVKAIEERDYAALEKLIREHNQSAMKAYMDYLNDNSSGER